MGSVGRVALGQLQTAVCRCEPLAVRRTGLFAVRTAKAGEMATLQTDSSAARAARERPITVRARNPRPTKGRAKLERQPTRKPS